MATTATSRRMANKAHTIEPATPFFEPSIVDEHGKLDHNRAPLIEGISAYRKQNMTSFATPGHKLGQGMDPELIALYGVDAFASDIPVSGGADAIHFNFDTWRLAEELGRRCLELRPHLLSGQRLLDR